MGAERKGRGQLSSIDLLPPEADDAIQWAVGELAARQRTQADILFELNDKLEAIGCERVSRSAFNRYSMRRAIATRRLREVSEIGKAVAETLGPQGQDDVTIMLVQMVKETAYALMERGDLSAKGLMEVSRAISAAIGAQKASLQVKDKKEAEKKQALEEAAEVAADGIARSTGLDGGEVLKMIRNAYGIEA